jgi:hypothetical protein
VFIPEEEGNLYPDTWYHNAAEVVRKLTQRHPIDIDNPTHMQEYYALLFQHQKDKPALTKAIENRRFAETDQQYQLIENRGIHVIVPFLDKASSYASIAEEARTSGVTKKLIRQAAPITVTSFEENISLYAEQLSFTTHGHGAQIPSPYYILREQYKGLYQQDMGLQLPTQEKSNNMVY